MRRAQRRGSERLGGLHGDQPVAGNGRDDVITPDLFERVGDVDPRYRAVGAVAHRGDDGIEERDGRKWARGIVHDDDLDVIGNRRETGAYRLGAGGASGYRRCDRRSAPRPIRWHHDDDRVARLPGHRDGVIHDATVPELLELLGAAETGASTRRDDDRPDRHTVNSGAS